MKYHYLKLKVEIKINDININTIYLLMNNLNGTIRGMKVDGAKKNFFSYSSVIGSYGLILMRSGSHIHSLFSILVTM